MKKILLSAMLLLSAGSMMALGVKEEKGRANFGELTFIAPEPAIMIATYDANGVPDVMMAAWGSQSGRNQIKIHMSEHKTSENIRLKKAFTVSFATVSTVAESDYFGSVSAHDDTDKVTTVGFTSHKAANVDAPVIEQYPVCLECKLVSYENGVLVGEVVNTSADKSVLNEQGDIDMEKLQPVVFDGISMSYRTIGTVVGKAWGSGNKFKRK